MNNEHFVKGTCTNGLGLISFKLGAFYPLQPIQAACVSYPHTSWLGGFDPSYTAAAPGLPEIMVRLMAQPFNRMKVSANTTVASVSIVLH